MIPCCVPFTWKICNVKPTEREDNILDTSRPMVPRDNLLRSYIVWRRAALIFLFPLSIAEIILRGLAFANEIQVLQDKSLVLTLLGWLCRLSQAILSSLAQLVGTGVAYAKWNNIKVSQKIFNSAIAISLVLYFWPAFVQIQHIYMYTFSVYYDKPVDEQLQTLKEELLLFASEELTMKFGFAIWLPFFLAIPSGSVRGAMNIMGLVNDSAVPGCLVLLLTPLGTLIHLALFTTAVQLYGNLLLGLGFLLLVVGKLSVFYFRTLYITGDVKEIDKQKVKLKGLVFTLVGAALLVTWACLTEVIVPFHPTQEPKTFIRLYLSDKTWVDVVLFVHGWFTKVCVYSLVFTDIILHIMLNCEGDRQWSCRGMRNFFY